MGIPLLTLIVKLNKWTESAKFFDGSALGECEWTWERCQRMGGSSYQF